MFCGRAFALAIRFIAIGAQLNHSSSLCNLAGKDLFDLVRIRKCNVTDNKWLSSLKTKKIDKSATTFVAATLVLIVRWKRG